jgi:hypothetical protein
MPSAFDELERLLRASQPVWSVPAAIVLLAALAAGFFFGLGFSLAQAVAG